MYRYPGYDPEAILKGAKDRQVSRAMSILPASMWKETIDAINAASSVKEAEEVMVQAIIRLHPRPINR
jgi:hypothetical protein